MKATLAAALLGVAALAFPFGSAQAAMFTPQQAPEITSGSDLKTDVATRQDRRQRTRQNWDRRRDGNRCTYRNGNCRHYHNGYYYETPWWTLPLIGGSIILNQGLNGGSYSSRHVQWCREHYRSYNVRTNTWTAYSGAVRQCVSPYRR